MAIDRVGPASGRRPDRRDRPLSDWLRRLAGLPGFAQGMEALAPLPAWLRIAVAVTAGIVEEVLFHGYAITRLARLLGSLWAAGVVATAVFAPPPF